tara:strand:- start:1638 stop:2069 length:432 start_codon:yes stop_codon:yes gene_type:complete
MKTVSDMGNPIWRKYIGEQIPQWLEWLKNIHLRSHFDLLEKFIELNPHFVPSNHDSVDGDTKLLEKLLWNPEFVHGLTDKGIQVWVSSTIGEFLDELQIYTTRFPEIKKVSDFFNSHIAWFERSYAFIRADIVSYLRANGRII